MALRKNMMSPADIDEPTERHRYSPKAYAGLGLVIVGSGLILDSFWKVIPQISNLYPETLPEQLFYIPEHADILYLIMPLVVIATFILLLAPGIFFTLTFGRVRGIGDLMLKGFGAAFMAHLLSTTAIKILWRNPIQHHEFFVAMIGLAIFGWAAFGVRVFYGVRFLPVVATSVDRRRAFWILAIPLIAVIVFLPAIFWQDLHGDAWEALEVGHSLSWNIIPRFPDVTAFKGMGMGLITSTYLVHWLITLFSPIEAAARMPIFLYLLVLFPGLLVLIEWKSQRQLRTLEEGIILLSLLGFFITMCFSASYHAYSADIAAPAALETFTVLCMMASAYFFWTEERGWFLLFVALGYLARPTGLLFLILLGIGIVVSKRQHFRPQLINIGLAIGLCLVVFVLYEKYLIPMVADGQPIGNSSAGILSRLRYLTFDDPKRLAYMAIPIGIIPFASLFMYRWQDQMAKPLAVVCLIYFILFFLQAFIALHHFAPVMLFPLIVFWRIILRWEFRAWIASSTAIMMVLSLWLSLPPNFKINRIMREIGHSTSYQIGNYNGSYNEYRTALKHRYLLTSLFSPNWKV